MPEMSIKSGLRKEDVRGIKDVESDNIYFVISLLMRVTYIVILDGEKV